MDTIMKSTSFGDLLRSWRTERRLSQADLALSIQTPSRHVSFMETGRSQPSREMIQRLATALSVPLRERNHLFRAAGFADIYADRRIGEEDAEVLQLAVTWLMTAHDPYPSFVVDRLWNVRDVNGSARKMLTPVARAFPLDDPEKPVNMLDLAFSANGLKPFVKNWEDYARQAIQRLHREALTDADLRAGLKRVAQYQDLPDDWWAFDVKYALGPAFTLEMQFEGLDLSFFSVVASVAVPTDTLAQELRVETLFPADQATEECLRERGT